MTISRNELNIIISARDEKMRKVFERAEKRAAKFERDTRRHTNRTGQHFSRLGSQAKRAGPAISSAFPASAPILASAGAVTAFGIALRSVVQNGDKLNQLRGRIEALTGSAVQAETGVEGLTSIMLETGANIDTAASAFTRFTQAGRNIGATQQEVLTLTDTLLKLGRVGGGTTQELNAGATQLAQALASGQLRGDELRSVMENLPLVTDALATSLGVSVGQLREMAEQGDLTARKVFDALLSKADEANEKFATLPVTVEMATGRMAAAWTRFTAQIDDSIGLSRTLAGILDTIANKLDRASLTGLDLVQAQIAERQERLAQRGPGAEANFPGARERLEQEIRDLQAVEAQYLRSNAAMTAAANERGAAEAAAAEEATKATGGGRAQAPLIERLDDVYGESIDGLIEREELIGKTADQQARLNAENALRNRLEAEAGDAIDRDGVRAEIEKLVTVYGELAVATHRAEEAERARINASQEAAQEAKSAAEASDRFISNTVDGLVNAGFAADSFSEGLKNIGRELAALATSDILKGLLGLGGGSGSIFGSVGSLLGSSSLGSLRFGFKDGVVGVDRMGRARGPGGPRGDKIPAMLSAGETVMTARATQRNAPMLRAMNEGKSFSGTSVFSPSTSFAIYGNTDDELRAEFAQALDQRDAMFNQRWLRAQKSYNERLA